MNRLFLRQCTSFLCASVATVTVATAGVASPYGINIHAPQGPDLAASMERVSSAGLGFVRVDFVWAAIEAQPNQFEWSAYDAIVAAAESRGIAILGILAYTPGWATDGPPVQGVPRAIADWEDFCFRVAHRYRGRVAAWELWNEPNQSHFWAGSRAQYVTVILDPGVAAVRAADPLAKVGGPGLAHLVSGDRDWYAWLLYVLVRSGDRLDFVSHHVYDRDGPGDVTTRLAATTPFGTQPEFWDLVNPSVREVLQQADAADRPFWLTETGWASDQVGDQGQANFTSGLLDRWFTGDPARSWITKIFFYELRDAATAPLWGLLRADWSAKPAYTAVRDFIAAHPGETPTVPELSLAANRFAVSVRWRDHSGGSGLGSAVPFSDQTGAFWFFSPANIELVVKILDGRPVNGRHWVFYGGLSDVEYWLTVLDRSTGERREYHNPSGTLCGGADTSAFPLGGVSFAAGSWTPPTAPPLFATPKAACSPGSGTLCLRDNRFRVEVAWEDHLNQRTGIGHALPLTDESGYFWFFESGNLELVVKVLDGRALNNRFWVFYGALSDVEYTITVTDTATGKRRRYRNASGNFCGRGDVEAF
jgi:Glycosyl hydrolases family 39